MYVNTTSIPIDTYGTGTILRCPPFSKILHINVKNNSLLITYSSEYYVTPGQFEPSWKSFNFKVLKGSWQSNSSVPSTHEYFDTIRIMEDDMIEYYHIFIEEIKTLQERRDGKIGELMDQDF